MHDTLVEQTIRPASSGKRPAGTYMNNQCYLTSVIRMQAILCADVYGIVALPKIAPLHQVVDPGPWHVVLSFLIAFVTWPTVYRPADGIVQRPSAAISNDSHSSLMPSVFAHTEIHRTACCIPSKSLGPMALLFFALDLFSKQSLSGSRTMMPAGIEPG